MASTTPNRGLPIPSGTDGVDVVRDVGNLATALDFPRYAANSVRTATTSGVTNIETLIDSVTFTALASRRYKVTWQGCVSISAGGNNTEVRLRFAAGASVTSGSSLIGGILSTSAGAENVPTIVIHSTTAISAGQVTIGAFLVVSSGAGTATGSAGATFATEMIVEDIT